MQVEVVAVSAEQENRHRNLRTWIGHEASDTTFALSPPIFTKSRNSGESPSKKRGSKSKSKRRATVASGVVEKAFMKPRQKPGNSSSFPGLFQKQWERGCREIRHILRLKSNP